MIRIATLICLLIGFTGAHLISQTVNQIDDKGRKQGSFIKYFDNNKIKYKGQFKDDIPYGKFTHYYNTGQVRSEVDFSKDGQIALTTTYYKNGNKMAFGKYINKKKDSVWNYYLDESDNPLISTETYENGLLEGESVTYYPDSGDPAEIIYYRNDKKHGKLLKYFPDGELMTESYYKNGLPDSVFMHYHPDGKLQIKGMYYNGIQAGNWEYFDESGSRLEKEEFMKQEQVKEIK